MKDRKRERSILQGHKRVGTKFIPPMAQMNNLQEISYVNQILPEVAWIGLLNIKFGYREGIELATAVSKAAFDINASTKHVNFALASSYDELGDAKKKSLLDKLTSDGHITKLQVAIQPLVNLYEEFPMRFIQSGSNQNGREENLESMKICVAELMDRRETPAMAAQAALVYIRGVTGGLKIMRNLEMPNLDAIVTEPDSEAAKRAGGFVRTSALMEFMPAGELKVTRWASYFWNRGYTLDSCAFEDASYDGE